MLSPCELYGRASMMWMRNGIRITVLCVLASCVQHVPSVVPLPAKPDVVISKPMHKATHISVAELSKYSPEFLYLAAQTALEQGRYQQATVFLQALNLSLNASEHDRWSVEPRMQLAQLWIKQGQAAKAKRVLQPLLTHYPIQKDDAVLRLYTLYARVLVAEEHGSDAVDVLTRVLHTEPDFLPARDLQIALLMQMHRWDLVHIAIHTAVQRHDAMKLHLWDADAYIQEKKYAQAVAALEQAQRLSPQSAEVVIKQSQLDVQLNHPKRAVTRLREFLKKYPEHTGVEERLAALYMQQGAVESAIRIYQDLDRQRPHHVALQLMLGRLFYKKGAFKEAEHYFRNAYQWEPQGESHAFYLAAVLEVQGKLKEAAALYQRVPSGDATWVQAQLALASMALRRGAYAQVEQKMHALVQQHPEEAHAWVLLSSAYLGEKKYQKLLDQTQGGLALQPVSARLVMNRAIALEHFKRYDEVEHVLQGLLKTQPNHAEALNFLGYTYAEQGIKLQQATQYIEHALKIKPNDAYYMDSLAWVYYQQGKYAKAIQLQRKALKGIGDDATMQEHLGDMLWRAGLQQEARAQWQKALTLKPEFPDVLHQKIAEGL